ncbi:hypothetical protein R1flu_011662 [Riccia fluitans]|uniref:Uncharacterized protein n=1 Tax=Riccia fluitans TaxID=41844 RepID=A0ABD1Z9C2_9MARC
MKGTVVSFILKMNIHRHFQAQKLYEAHVQAIDAKEDFSLWTRRELGSAISGNVVSETTSKAKPRFQFLQSGPCLINLFCMENVRDNDASAADSTSAVLLTS